MSLYTPDCWQIIKIQAPGHDPYYRILAGWSGSYLEGASWKLSSGIESFNDFGDHYLSDQSSGSVYKIYKTGERMSGIMAIIFTTYCEQATNQGWTVEVISLEDFLKEYISLEDFLKEYNGKIESI